MTENRFEVKNDYHKGLILVDNLTSEIIEEDIGTGSCYNSCNLLNRYDEDCKMYREDALKAEKNKEVLLEENEQLKKELNKLKKFEHGGEHIRLSINIETGELQRHIYATGQWFGDFDRILVENWLSKEDYQRFIDRLIEVYNTEFKKECRK